MPDLVDLAAERLVAWPLGSQHAASTETVLPPVLRGARGYDEMECAAGSVYTSTHKRPLARLETREGSECNGHTNRSIALAARRLCAS